MYPNRYTGKCTWRRCPFGRPMAREWIQRQPADGSTLRAEPFAGGALARLRVPATILTGADDPIIPVTDFHRLTLAPDTELDIASAGGLAVDGRGRVVQVQPPGQPPLQPVAHAGDRAERRVAGSADQHGVRGKFRGARVVHDARQATRRGGEGMGSS